MRAREIVGYRIRKERTRRGLSQAALGEIISGLTGTKWYPQTVGAAEQGERAFTVDDLIALSIALTLTIEQLTTAPPGETMDLGPHRFTDWDEQDATVRPATVQAVAGVPSPTTEDRLIADVERATQALVDYVKTAPPAKGRIRLRSTAKGSAVSRQRRKK
jgi:transcriptional regulator with XRE-family HTH domain